MTVKYRPLWFTDIIAAEKWLEKQAESGLRLSSYNFIGKFTFEDSLPDKGQIRLIYEKHCGGKAPRGIIEKGWEQLCGAKYTYALRNGDREAKLSYTGFQTILRFIMFGLYFLMCFVVGTMLGSGMAFIESLIDGTINEPGAVVFFLISDLHFILPFILVLIAVLYIHRSLKKISKVDSTKVKGTMRTLPAEVLKYSKEEEKKLIKEGKIIKKTKPGWFYNPDNAAKLIEENARNGWKFYRMNEMGTDFFFEKAEPTHICFVTDFCDNISEEYIAAVQADGWTLQFMSMTRVLSYAMWTKEYDGECPVFYSDNDTEYHQKKKFFMWTGLPVLAFGIFSFVFEAAMIISSITEGELPSAPIKFCMGTYLLVGIECTVFGVNGLKYFLKARKNRA